MTHRNPGERIDQIRQNTTKSCAYFTGYTASQGYNYDGTDYCSFEILHKKLTAFFQIVPKIVGNNTYCPGCWSLTLTGSEFAHHCAYIWQKPTMLKCFSIDSPAINDFIWPFVDKNVLFMRVTSHERHTITKTILFSFITHRASWYMNSLDTQST